MKPKKFTQIQRIKRLENIVSQIYMSVEVIKKQLEKDESKQFGKKSNTKKGFMAEFYKQIECKKYI